MEIFKKRNNLAGKIFQLKSKSHYVNCFDADSGQKPFIIPLQFRQVKWFLRKVRLVVFSQIFVGRVSRPRARATFAPGGKSSQKRRLDLRSKNPLARGETVLAGNFPTRPRRFFRFFSSVRRTVPAQLPAWRCRAPLAGATVGVCALPVLAIIRPRQSRPKGGFGRCMGALLCPKENPNSLAKSAAVGVYHNAYYC